MTHRLVTVQRSFTDRSQIVHRSFTGRLQVNEDVNVEVKLNMQH